MAHVAPTTAMPSKHKTPLLGWHPPAELSAWVRDEAQRRDVRISVVLNEAIAEKRERESTATIPNRKDTP